MFHVQMEKQNTSPRNLKQQCLEFSVSQLSQHSPATTSPSVCNFFNNFFDGFFITSLNGFLEFFIQTFFNSGNTTIGSKVREASFAADDTDLVEVEPCTHGVSRVTPCRNFFLTLSCFTFISSFFSFNRLNSFICGCFFSRCFSSNISIFFSYGFISNRVDIGTASATNFGSTTKGFFSSSS